MQNINKPNKIKRFLSNVTETMSEFLKSDRSFYKYNKQTILHLLYRIFVVLISFFCIILPCYIFAEADRASTLTTFLYILGSFILLTFGFIIWVHIYYIFIKKDITPLQSEQHQIIKEFLTKVQGDSLSEVVVIDSLKAITNSNAGEKLDG